MNINQLEDKDKLTLDALDKIRGGNPFFWKNNIKDKYDPTELNEGELDHVQAGILSQEEIDQEREYLENLSKVLDERKKSCEQGRTR